MSEDSSSEERNDRFDEIILSETDEEVIIQSDEDLECDEPVPRMLNLLVIKTVLLLPPAVQRNVKLLEMEKVKKKKKKVDKYNELEWQKHPPVGDMKKQVYWYTGYIVCYSKH